MLVELCHVEILGTKYEHMSNGPVPLSPALYCTSLHSTSKIYIMPLQFTVKHCTAVSHDLKESWKHARIQTAQVMVTPTPSSSAGPLCRVRWIQVYCRATELSRICLNLVKPIVNIQLTLVLWAVRKGEGPTYGESLNSSGNDINVFVCCLG